MFDSLHVRNFRLYATGLAISGTGSWVQFITQDWLVMKLTGSASAVGITIILFSLPPLLLGPYGGVLADRLPKRKLLLVTQSVMGLNSAALAILTLSGQVQVWNVWLTALILGLVTAVDFPSTQSFMSEIVESDRLANAVSLHQASQFTRLSGAAVAGLLLATIGVGYEFLVNAASYAAMIGVLLLMRVAQLRPTKRPPRTKGQLREGLRYVAARPELVRSIALVGFLGTFGFNLPVWLPAFTDHVFHRNAGAYDLLNCLVASGGIAGALFTLRRRDASSRLLLGAAVLFGVLLAMASYAPDFWLFAALLVPIGVMIITFNNTANTSVQLSSDPEMRGRVTALYMMVVTGATPIGAPLVGWVTDTYGARFGMAAGGAVSALAAVAIIWALSPTGRRQLNACWRLGRRAMSCITGRGRASGRTTGPISNKTHEQRRSVQTWGTVFTSTAWSGRVAAVPSEALAYRHRPWVPHPGAGRGAPSRAAKSRHKQLADGRHTVGGVVPESTRAGRSAGQVPRMASSTVVVMVKTCADPLDKSAVHAPVGVLDRKEAREMDCSRSSSGRSRPLIRLSSRSSGTR
ncbi:MFS transporter [Streptomyces sp. NBC_01619]|uniref:MFS transporter n=1 Tax=Streptomyces sp. NBC_01619 TaxID=2975901 RepID=UPI002B1CDDA8|nr:MFS transporter [Streptomyces sp. NBC_01619]